MNTPTLPPSGYSPAPLPKILIDPRKVRAARAVLGWTQAELSEKSGVSHGSIVHFETGQRTMMRQNLRALQRAFEAAGVKFASTYKGAASMEWQEPKPPTHPQEENATND